MRLKKFKITKELLNEKGVKCDNDKMSSFLAKKTLDILCPGVMEIYNKSCMYIHPSVPLIRASWFGKKPNTLVYKDWLDVQPFNYDSKSVTTDYLNTCIILLRVMYQCLNIKLINVECAESITGPAIIASEEHRKEFMESIKPFLHEGEMGEE